MKRHIINIILVSVLLCSCTKTVEIDIPGFEEQYVIDGSIETGQPPIVLITKSQEIYAPTDLDAFLGSFISGATVTVSNGTNTVTLTEICTDNIPPGFEQLVADLLGVPVDELANYHICGYTAFDPSIFGEVGKTYNLTVSIGEELYTASTDIVQPTYLNSVFWQPDGELTTHGYSWANLTDPIDPNDSYKWEVKRINTDVNGDPIDANFTEPFSPVFDDEFFNGLTFDFFYDNPHGYEAGVLDEHAGLFPLGDTVVIKFSKMDPAIYKFMEAKYTQLATAGNPFATPTNIPSNVTGGALGVWAGYSPIFDTLICQP